MKFIMFKRGMIVLNSNYNQIGISITVGINFMKHIKFQFLFWSIDFAYDKAFQDA